MPYNLGRFLVNNNLQSLVSLTRVIPTNINDYVELGYITTNSGAHNIFITIYAFNAVSKQFNISLHANQTNGEWFRVVPLNSTPINPPNDFQLDAMSDGLDVYFRVRRSSGTTPGVLTANIQNIGDLDETFNSQVGTGNTAQVPTGSLASIPHTTGTVDHNTLFNRGTNTHSQIDAHIEAINPHTGHESISNKNQPNGYPGLDGSGKIDTSHIKLGNTADSVCSGNDSRLNAIALASSHASNHSAGGSDEVRLENLAGNLTQSRTHDSNDSDISANSIHHSLGSSATQAAPGDHKHDTIYASIDKGVNGGNSHNHAQGGSVEQVNHSDLIGAGNSTHAQIDSHILAQNPHSGHESIANKNIPNGYAGLTPQGQLPDNLFRFGQDSGSVCAGDDPRLTSERAPAAHASTHKSTGSDPLFVIELSGNLPQSRSHDSVDTDASITALHHTLGSNATQAAPGNHNHNGIYAPSSNGVTGGDSHAHTGSDGSQINHNSLLNKGTYSHSQLDSHVDSEAPHSGHELTSNKGVANGYAALDSTSKISGTQIPFGSVAQTACEGNDPRLTDTRSPTSHSSTHSSSGSDAIALSDLSGNLNQSRTHGSADTDSANSALHHTLGTGAYQAAPGNHTHGEGSGNQLSHTQLADIGENTHQTIDGHIAGASPHSGHEVKTNKNVAGGYAGLDSSGNIIFSQIPVGSTDTSVCSGNDARLSDRRLPTTHASSHSLGGSDTILLQDLDGSLTQSSSHDSADTDLSQTALHHTLGTGVNQAAPGNHTHSNYIPISGGSMTGMLVLAADPTQPLHPVTKQYAEMLLNGLIQKESVSTATSTPIVLSGLIEVSGYTVSENERVLVKDQLSAIDNGVYLAKTGTWIRAEDFDGTPNGEVKTSACVYVSKGDLAGTGWQVITSGAIEVGVTPITFTQFSGPGSTVPGVGLNRSGNSLYVTTVNSGRISVTAQGVDLGSVGTSGEYTKVTTDSYGRVISGSQLSKTDIPTIDATQIGSGAVSNTQFGYLSGVTSSVQLQIDGKSPTGHHHQGTDIDSIVDNSDKLDGYHAGDFVLNTDVVAVAASNKILKLDSNGKLPASITGDAATLNGNASSYFSTSTHNHDSSYSPIVHNHDLSYSALGHKHNGSDIQSAVASAVDSDTLDGKHAIDFVLSSSVSTTPSAGKILPLDTNSKLPTSITGDSDTVDGKHAADFVLTSEIVSAPTADKVLRLDASSKLPASITGDAATVGGLSAGSFVLLTEIVTVAEPNKVLKLDSNSKLPTSITGDSDTVDGKHAADFVLSTDVVTSASANKLLKLDGSAILQATVLNSQQLGGVGPSGYAVVSHNHNSTYSTQRTNSPGAAANAVDGAYTVYDQTSSAYQTADNLHVLYAASAGSASSATTATTATTSNRVRTADPGSYIDGDIWIN